MATRVTRASVEAQQTPKGDDTLVTLRLAAAKGDATAYGARRAYAVRLIDALGIDFWKKKSLGFSAFVIEREAYDVALKSEGHPNPSQAHARLRQAAEAYQNGETTRGPRAKVELTKRAEAEVGALFRAFEREEDKVGLNDREEVIFSALRAFIGATGIKVAK